MKDALEVQLTLCTRFSPIRYCLFEMSKNCQVQFFFLVPNYQENHDVLKKCLMEDKQFACIVYKALLQWRSFEAEKTNIFDRIIHTIYSSIESRNHQ
ncbi:unnamed protein product, partial [Vitis vinifera]